MALHSHTDALLKRILTWDGCGPMGKMTLLMMVIRDNDKDELVTFLQTHIAEYQKKHGPKPLGDRVP